MSTTNQIGPVLKAWYQWKSLRLPWRKRFLVGLDLRGNTYWEFRLQRGDPTSHPNNSQSERPQSYPFRRIIHYPRSTYLSEVSVPPAWHQWLRYQRMEAPTLDEQVADVARQERIKVLAAEADARWAAKGSYMDRPGHEKGQAQAVPAPALDTERTQPQAQSVRSPGDEDVVSRGATASGTAAGGNDERIDEQRQQQQQQQKKKKKKKAATKERGDDPWKNADARRGGPSETWQPEAWNPTTTTTTNTTKSASPKKGKR